MFAIFIILGFSEVFCLSSPHLNVSLQNNVKKDQLSFECRVSVANTAGSVETVTFWQLAKEQNAAHLKAIFYPSNDTECIGSFSGQCTFRKDLTLPLQPVYHLDVKTTNVDDAKYFCIVVTTSACSNDGMTEVLKNITFPVSKLSSISEKQMGYISDEITVNVNTGEKMTISKDVDKDVYSLGEAVTLRVQVPVDLKSDSYVGFFCNNLGRAGGQGIAEFYTLTNGTEKKVSNLTNDQKTWMSTTMKLKVEFYQGHTMLEFHVSSLQSCHNGTYQCTLYNFKGNKKQYSVGKSVVIKDAVAVNFCKRPRDTNNSTTVTTIVRTTAMPDGSNHSSGDNVALIVGLVCGGVILIIAAVVICCCFYRRNKTTTKPKNSQYRDVPLNDIQ